MIKSILFLIVMSSHLYSQFSIVWIFWILFFLIMVLLARTYTKYITVIVTQNVMSMGYLSKTSLDTPIRIHDVLTLNFSRVAGWVLPRSRSYLREKPDPDPTFEKKNPIRIRHFRRKKIRNQIRPSIKKPDPDQIFERDPDPHPTFENKPDPTFYKKNRIWIRP